MDTEPESDKGTDKDFSIDNVRGDLMFKDIDFSYVPGEKVLHDFDLWIKSGQKLAIVGATGSGKTTVVNLLTRFYDIDGGSITLDGESIYDIPKKKLRGSIGIVLQDTVIFNDTIMQNIRYGRLDATDEEVIAAAKTAKVADFAEKICGLHFAFADMSVTGSILGLTSYSDVDLTISVPRGNGSVQEFHLNGNIAYVDQNLANAGSVGRLNFTLVHEAAHQILGMLYPEEYNPSAQPFICRLADERCSYPITDWVEWQTNVLTAYLLLPRELIDRYMDELGLGRQIKLLNKVFAPKEYALFSEMAKRLGASKTALSIRLDNLGMIGRNDFSDPYAPIHIYADDFDTA